MTASETWSTVLDALEVVVAQQQEAVEEGRHDDVHGFAAPVGLGDLPDALAPRAQQLLARMTRLQDELEHAVADVASQRALVQRSRLAQRPRGELDRVL